MTDFYDRCPKCGGLVRRGEACQRCAPDMPAPVASVLGTGQAPASPTPVTIIRTRRMSKWEIRAILAVVTVFVLAAAAWGIYNYVPGIKPIPAGWYTRAQLEQVKKGMTYLDVVRIFNGMKPDKPLQQETDDYGPYLWAAWENPDGSEAVVFFNLDGFVMYTDSIRLPR